MPRRKSTKIARGDKGYQQHEDDLLWAQAGLDCQVDTGLPVCVLGKVHEASR